MKKFVKYVALAFAVASSASVVAFDAMALPAYGYEKTYYSDASMSTQVGEEVMSCSGHHTLTGVRTAYVLLNYEEKCCVTSNGGQLCEP